MYLILATLHVEKHASILLITATTQSYVITTHLRTCMTQELYCS